MHIRRRAWILAACLAACGGSSETGRASDAPDALPSEEAPATPAVPAAPDVPAAGTGEPAESGEPATPEEEQAALPPSGDQKWALEMAAPSFVESRGVAVSPLGNVFEASVFNTGMDFGDGPATVPGSNAHAALVKFSPSGKLVWKRVFSSTIGIQAYAAAVDGNGSSAIVGSFSGKTEFGTADGTVEFEIATAGFIAVHRWDGELLWKRSAIAPHAAYWPTFMEWRHASFDSEGNLVVAGQFRGAGFDFGDGIVRSAQDGDVRNTVVAKYDRTGKALWVKVYEPSDESGVGPASMAVAPDGRIALAMAFRGKLSFEGSTVGSNALAGQDQLLAVLDANGKLLWVKTWEVPVHSMAFSNDALAVTSSVIEPLSFGGKTLTPRPDEWDGLVAVFDASGSERWAQLLSSTARDGFDDVSFGPAGDVYVSGVTEGETATLGERALTGKGFVVARLSANGTPLWIQREVATAQNARIAVAADGSLAVGATKLDSSNAMVLLLWKLAH